MKESLKMVQRVFKLAPSFHKTKALLDAGLHSAASIHSMGQDRVVKGLGGKDSPFTTDEANDLFNRAANIRVATSLLAGQLKPQPVALPSWAYLVHFPPRNSMLSPKTFLISLRCLA